MASIEFPDAATDAALREAICAAGRRLGARRLVAATEGNLSVRIGPGLLLTTPTGRRKDELRPDDLAIVSLDEDGTGSISGPPPSSDIAIHRAIYRARHDVAAVAHAHLPSSMGLTLAGEAPDPLALPETALFLPRLPYVAFGAMGSRELAGRIAAALADGPEPLPGAALLERHGAVAVGASLDQAIDRLELVDVLCAAWRDALLLRTARGESGLPSSL